MYDCDMDVRDQFQMQEEIKNILTETKMDGYEGVG